ncbi:MAG: competence protein ComFB [Candidatus Omnitrophota bacterium]|nr:late competence development ComFB family protein [Candidatus Omnitrophota bacterium]RKY30372.1 MAG: competence protein ComFB [Candidatus Omnitrophota bacterium]RKY36422.1 MAG: competence protein ComFB [Candidatus Omnitrophota bacterium]RKY45765.1 MAG: competence protein ComFB [Candidatus Omnitrophota bacterium]HDN86035.1 competence protein ComFB [Candidatus Omnitrophota bacterium]
MECHNYMEDIVRNTLENLLSKRNDVCKCEKCTLDMMALALNNLPPKYVVTDKGRVYTKIAELELQLRTDVVREITKAIDKVKKAPQH